MVAYDLNELPRITEKIKPKNPLMLFSDYVYHRKPEHIKRLLLKLNNPVFDNIRSDPRFIEIINKIPEN